VPYLQYYYDENKNKYRTEENGTDEDYYSDYVFNACGQITQVWMYAEIYNIADYTYDSKANLSSEYVTLVFHNGVTDDYNVVKTYTYDNGGRLTQETNSRNDKKRQYEYDSNGNITRRIVSTLSTGAVQSDNLNWYDQNNGMSDGYILGYDFDANGNAVTEIHEDASEIYYEYDAHNRISQVRNSAKPYVDYEYNSDNLRIKKIESDTFPQSSMRYYGYDKEGNLVLEKDAYISTDKTAFIWNGEKVAYMKVNGTLCGLASDAKNNASMLRYYEDGAFKQDLYYYLAFGELDDYITTCLTAPISYNSAIRNPIRYGNYYYDSDTELYYLKNRYYSLSALRFMTRDPYWNVDNMLYGSQAGNVKRNVYYPAGI